MSYSAHDRTILRDLAHRVAEIAALPVMQTRRNLWEQHNALRPVRPLVLLFPEGAWGEMLPGHGCQCESEAARGLEWGLRARIYTYEHFQDDSVIDTTMDSWPVLRDSGWGLEAKRSDRPEERGAWTFEPVLKDAADLKKLCFPEVTFDAAATQAGLASLQELFGDILQVRPAGVRHISFHLMSQFTGWHGLAETMMDMVAEPQFIHDAMAFLEEGNRRRVQQLVDLNLLQLNNDNTYHSSGGNGFTKELPAPGFDPARVRLCDMWGSAEAQELAQVSPEMHAEFVLPYEKRLLAPFGLTGYGCCEDLTGKLDDVFTIPHIRRISISPWSNVDTCAARLQGHYIFSWKPQPADMCGDFNQTRIRAYIRHTLEAAKANHCVLELILKDTHTCENHPERFDQWTRIARELISELWPA